MNSSLARKFEPNARQIMGSGLSEYLNTASRKRKQVLLWGYPGVPIYGGISKNRHIAAYGKDANIAFLVYS